MTPGRDAAEVITVEDWAEIDRLVHHAEVLTLSGDSYRTRSRRELLAKDRAGHD